MLLMFLFVVAPIMVEYIWSIPSGKGDWLSFWGSYLGIIPSGLIAYFVAKYQIDKEHEFVIAEKNREYLPYFNIKDNKLVFSSMRENIPVQWVQIDYYDKENHLLKVSDDSRNLGHIFPGTYIAIPLSSRKYSRIDISCTLVNGRDIFFSYGNGVNGSHFIKQENGKFEPYILEKTFEAQTQAWHRVNQIK